MDFFSVNVYTIYTNSTVPKDQFTFTLANEYLLFSVKACKDIQMVFSRVPGVLNDDAYTIILGHDDNTKSTYRKEGPASPIVQVFNTPNLLDCNSLTVFWILWENTQFRLGTGSVLGQSQVMSYTDPDQYNLNAVSVGSDEPGAIVEWQFYREEGT